MSVSVTVENTDQVIRALQRAGDAGKRAANRATKETTEAVLVRAKAAVPVQTAPYGGFSPDKRGRDSLMTRYNEEKVRGIVTHSADTFYLRFVEFGTRRARAKPWLFPAAEAERSQHNRRLEATLKAEMGLQ